MCLLGGRYLFDWSTADNGQLEACHQNDWGRILELSSGTLALNVVDEEKIGKL